MTAYFFKEEPESDYERLRTNGMWYQHWQSGYSDIIKKGHSRPKDQDTILAELYSPKTSDFLHGGTGAVPFLISERALKVFQESGFTGFRLANVEVAKVATKGKRNRKANMGEPEDAILSRRDVKAEVPIPKLHAVYVTGSVQAVPDFPSGRCPSGYVSPFKLEFGCTDVPDLFQPEFNREPFSAWAFCSERFRNITLSAGLTNIFFQPFDEFMTDFRNKVTKG
jgi:hypothetical protein